MDDSTLNFHAYAATLQQVMADAIQKAEDLQAEANAEREAMFADQEKTRDLLREAENTAQRKAEGDLSVQYGELKQKMIASLLRKLKAAGRTEAEIEVLEKALSGKR
jgi:hypothetical protein